MGDRRGVTDSGADDDHGADDVPVDGPGSGMAGRGDDVDAGFGDDDAPEDDEDRSGWAGGDDRADTGAASLDRLDPVERLRGLVTYLATNLVDAPDEVEVTVEQRGAAVHVGVRVAPDDLGKVIGRQGRVARAMRTTLMIAGSRDNLRTSLAIEE